MSTIFPAAGFGEFVAFSRSGGLQADLLGGLGGGAPRKKGRCIWRVSVFHGISAGVSTSKLKLV